MSNEGKAYVLYVDHEGHPAPLSLCYHATASRRLASAVDRYPASTVTEVDSAYCPQCLSFHDAATAATIGYCPKATCRICPLCRSAASIVVNNSECIYKCGLCEWTSRNCNLAAPVAVGADGVVRKEDLETAAQEIGNELLDRQSDKDEPIQIHFKALQQAKQKASKDHAKGPRHAFYSSSALNARRGQDGPEGWSIQSLEESIVTRKQKFADDALTPVGDLQILKTGLDEESALDKSFDGKPDQSLQLNGGLNKSLSDLLPLPIPLRSRRSRRCRAELAEGRPGILVKPKLNPLEGDSSLRTGHGQWWKKDSSAVQVIPRVHVVAHGSENGVHALLLKISNPTLGSIRLRLQSSSYAGEPMVDDNDKTSTLLESLVVDTLTQTVINVKMADDTTSNSLEETEICELEAAEDSFLELGRSANDEPDVVTAWDARAVLSGMEASSPSRLKFLAKKSAAAWFELVLPETSDLPDIYSYSAVPLAMVIEVGGGSWESSLIQPKPDRSDENPDMIAFDLLVAWPRQSSN